MPLYVCAYNILCVLLCVCMLACVLYMLRFLYVCVCSKVFLQIQQVCKWFDKQSNDVGQD